MKKMFSILFSILLCMSVFSTPTMAEEKPLSNSLYSFTKEIDFIDDEMKLMFSNLIASEKRPYSLNKLHIGKGITVFRVNCEEYIFPITNAETIVATIVVSTYNDERIYTYTEEFNDVLNNLIQKTSVEKPLVIFSNQKDLIGMVNGECFSLHTFETVEESFDLNITVNHCVRDCLFENDFIIIDDKSVQSSSSPTWTVYSTMIGDTQCGSHALYNIIRNVGLSIGSYTLTEINNYLISVQGQCLGSTTANLVGYCNSKNYHPYYATSGYMPMTNIQYYITTRSSFIFANTTYSENTYDPVVGSNIITHSHAFVVIDYNASSNTIRFWDPKGFIRWSSSPYNNKFLAYTGDIYQWTRGYITDLH